MINIEKQSKEAFTWYVVYDDHTTLSEDDTNCFADALAQAHITELLLMGPEGWAPHRVEIPHDATAVFFRRRQLVINPMDGQQKSRPTIHCIGWKRGDEAVYLFVFADGSTLLTDNLQAV